MSADDHEKSRLKAQHFPEEAGLLKIIQPLSPAHHPQEMQIRGYTAGCTIKSTSKLNKCGTSPCIRKPPGARLRAVHVPDILQAYTMSSYLTIIIL
jgi:hypothetical protein